MVDRCQHAGVVVRESWLRSAYAVVKRCVHVGAVVRGRWWSGARRLVEQCVGGGCVVPNRWWSSAEPVVERCVAAGGVVPARRWSGADVVDWYSEDLHLVVRAQNAQGESSTESKDIRSAVHWPGAQSPPPQRRQEKDQDHHPVRCRRRSRAITCHPRRGDPERAQDHRRG